MFHFLFSFRPPKYALSSASIPGLAPLRLLRLNFSNLGSFFARVKAAIIHACLSDLSRVASIAILVWYGVRFQNSTGLIPATTAAR